jgi:ATP-dependent protease ClpP protease subunit
MKQIEIDGVIGTGPGEVSSRFIKSQLPTDNSPIVVRIHSEGGSVFEAFAIYDLIDSYKGHSTGVVASMAFSAASLILCACDEAEATANAYVMVHSPHMDDADDGPHQMSPSEKKLLASLRERMIAIYSRRTGKPSSVISRLVDQETFFDVEAAIGLGIVDRISNRTSAVNARLPRHVLAKLGSLAGQSAEVRWRGAVAVARSSGLSLGKAVLSVDRSSPGLRQRFIDEANGR